VTIGVEGRYVVLTVADTGVGMSAEEQEHIFERFFRAEEATQRAVQGLGLELTIVKAIVNAHSTVTVQSEPGRGTVFRVLLPLGQAQAGHAGGLATGAQERREAPEAVKVVGRDRAGQ
jgi:signal transduction histidine kinase